MAWVSFQTRLGAAKRFERAASTRAVLQKRGSLAAAMPRNPVRAREFGPSNRKCIDQLANDLIAIAEIGAPLRQFCFAARRLAVTIGV